MGFPVMLHGQNNEEDTSMKPHVSSFERGRSIVRALVVLAVVLGISALFFTVEDSSAQFILVIGAAACVVAVIVVANILCVCPHCGKHIVSGVLVARVCPRCNYDLITGTKVKKQKR